ncbi:MAG: SDR family NAD(P)-dependent oxidoreductase [Pseudomonadota bacterium]
MDAVVFGASGGIGAALTQALAARADVRRVHAVSRTPPAKSERIEPHAANILDEDDLAGVAKAVAWEGAPDLVIVAAGVLSDGDRLQPEKSYRHQSLDAFEAVFRLNTFAPALIAKHMLPIMPRKGRAVFAALSARVGSITDNGLGGWHAYRASKSALNMLIRNYAIEQARRNEDFIAAGLHPGTVDTDLSRPFQSGLPDGQVISPDRSAAALLGVIDGLAPADSGKLFDWRGDEIPA